MPQINFKPLQLEDLPRIHRWVNTEPLLQIWNHGETKTYAQIVAKYAPKISGADPSPPFLIEAGGEPIGYIQTYLWRDYPDYAQYLNLTEEAASLDVFIGEAAYRGRGIGTQMLKQFLREIIFANPVVQSCIITPEVANIAAHRAYEKAGFRHVKTIEHPDEPTPVYLMRIGRDEQPSE